MTYLAVSVDTSNRRIERDNPARETFDRLAQPAIEHLLLSNVYFPPVARAIANVFKSDPSNPVGFEIANRSQEVGLDVYPLNGVSYGLKDYLFQSKVSDQLNGVPGSEAAVPSVRATEAPSGRVLAASSLAA